jgi:hypothetical protein
MADTHTCLVCAQTSADVPLIALEYRNQEFWICPQHLPILIHHPHELADKLPGAEHLPKADHQH